MKITCSNFGPIKNGTLDISKSLIIICGANNSGKTYFSYLLYGLLKANVNFKVEKNFIPVKHLRIIDHQSIPDTFDIGVKIDLIELFRDNKKEILSELSKYAHDCAQMVFPAGSDLTLAKFSFSEVSDATFSSNLFEISLERSEVYNSTDTERQPKSFRVYKRANENEIEIRISEKKTERDINSLIESDVEVIHHALLKEFLLLAFKATGGKIRFFPAERIAIDIFSKDISNSRQDILKEVESAQMQAYASKDSAARAFFGLLFNSKSDNFYSAPLKDAIVTSAVIFMHSREEGPVANLARQIEDQILQGSLVFGDKEENFQIKFIATGSPPVKIELASSMVKSLAPLVLYLKHQATPEDIIIIDEPELCLHPGLQRKLAIILARAVKKGIKVIISTHSDFFVREFNNLIMLNRQSDEALSLRKKYLYLGYDSNTTLNLKDLGVNLFLNGEIQEVECTETGFSISLIDQVIEDQNNVSQDIFFSLF